MKARLLEKVFVAGLALVLATLVRGQISEPDKGIVLCAEDEHPITGSKFSFEATNQAGMLIAWNVAQTHWTVHETPPICVIPPAQMRTLFSGEESTDLKIEAIYSEKNHTVYLLDSWQPNDLRDRSVLLHELVHHLQYLNDVKKTCPQEGEWQAFHLQVEWLIEQGAEDPFELIGINPLFFLMLGRCDEM